MSFLKGVSSTSNIGHRALLVVVRTKILIALEVIEGNKTRTAEDLGISYKTLLNNIKEFAL